MRVGLDRFVEARTGGHHGVEWCTLVRLIQLLYAHPMSTDFYTGPVDYLVFSFPRGAAVDAGLQQLKSHVDAGTVVLLDVEVIGRGDDGAPVHLSLSELEPPGGFDLSAFADAESRILDDEDLVLIAQELAPGWVAVAVVYEERSMADVVQSWSDAGGTLLLSGGVDLVELDQALSGTENGEL